MNSNNTQDYKRDSGIGGDDFAPPETPPPPKVPVGWTVRWDDRYQRWYYVNLPTKRSQWEKPEGTIEAPESESSSRPASRQDQPPAYQQLINTTSSPTPSTGSDKPPAIQLPPPLPHQGSASNYYESFPSPHVRVETPAGDQTQHKSHKGLTSKLAGFLRSHSNPTAPSPQHFPQQFYARPQPPVQQQYYSNHLSPGYTMPCGATGGSRRPGGGGMGLVGAAALGVGGGLPGGMVLGQAFDDDYQDGFEDGADFGADFGGDF
ncbi:hypothetical protein L873DRAFT_1790857 [Choiromyces venosus 120613-1]|uniref:WW domain-containing protein n=1 Tax=Choiromyces venosus 120613-1 TaxID=1336337 RepID=A0A3N4JHH2_9PEZI|nr:hypothetical protein L873DRAFT_1790857 [Choiromyces venosus 120613-1]